MSVKWMLEPDVFPGDCDLLIEALERLEVPNNDKFCCTLYVLTE